MREIPSITSGELKRRAARIKPLLRFAEGEAGPFLHRQGYLYYLVEERHPRPLTWGAKPSHRAEGLDVVTTIETYHCRHTFGMFLPRAAEVLAQIPSEHLDQVIAFEVPVDIVDVRKVPNFHIARTTLYRAAV